MRLLPLIICSPSNIGGLIDVNVCLGAGVSPLPPPNLPKVLPLTLFLYSPHSIPLSLLSAVRFSGNLRSGTIFNLRIPIVFSWIHFSQSQILFHTGRTLLVFTTFWCFSTSELTGMRSKGAYTSIERIVDGESTLLLCLIPSPSHAFLDLQELRCTSMD